MNANSLATNKNGLYLLTGTSGTGKSTVCEALASRGITTVDGDSIAKWVDRSTGSTPRKTHPTNAAWVDKHFWEWDKTKIEDLHKKAAKEIIILAGSADHMETFWHSFKKVFLLELSPAATTNRVLNRESHDYGKGEGQIEVILAWKEELSELADTLGAVRIDATPSPDIVTLSILEQL